MDNCRPSQCIKGEHSSVLCAVLAMGLETLVMLVDEPWLNYYD